jgi:hypothetical protein
MGVSAILKNPFYGAEPPWGSKVKWQIVNRDLDSLICRHYDALKDAVMLARDFTGPAGVHFCDSGRSVSGDLSLVSGSLLSGRQGLDRF